MKIELRVLSDEEMADEDAWRDRRLLEEAWQLWQVASCEERGGHWWWLELDPVDGIHLHCLHCPAGVDDVYPDGYELMFGEFEVFTGYKLSLGFGSVLVNGRDDAWYAHGWYGPVTIELRIEEYRSYWEGSEWEVSIDVEPA
jgi:hypothetical protein